MKHGIGKIYYTSGSLFDGFWANDKANGEGTFKYTNGDVFKGFFKDGLKHGMG